MDTAAATQTYSNQFRMAIYDFGAAASRPGCDPVSLSSSLTSAKTAAGNIDLMTVNGQNDNNDQDTRFTNDFSRHQQCDHARPARAHLRADEIPVLCLRRRRRRIQYRLPQDRPPVRRCQSPINPALCTTLKNRGIKIAVLYTTYLALPTNAWYNTWIAPFNLGPYGPSPNSEIAQNMTELCIAWPILRGQPDPGHFPGHERIVPEGDRRRADQQLTDQPSSSASGSSLAWFRLPRPAWPEPVVPVSDLA